MKSIVLKEQPITIDLGSMQILREHLDGIKLHLKTNSDREAVNELIFQAEQAFTKYVETYG
jgi:hypothetical protein